MHRTLLVEDHSPMRVLNRLLLEDSGRFQIVGEARDGREAIHLAKSLAPDLILLDLAMPVLGGMDALPILRVAAPLACIIVVSMLQRQESETQALRLGAQAFIDKGLDSDEFIRRVLAVIDGPTRAPAYS